MKPKKHNRNLALAAMVLATEIVRFAIKLLDFWGMTSNYAPYNVSEVDFSI